MEQVQVPLPSQPYLFPFVQETNSYPHSVVAFTNLARFVGLSDDPTLHS